MNIYFLSGLGADKRAYQHLTFPPSFNLIYIDWIPPQKGETLQHYAERISKRIDSSKPFVLIGLSFGGAVATEVIEFVKPEKTFLLSSVSSKNELPFYYRWIGHLGINKLVPEKFTTQATLFTYWFFGITSAKDKLLLNEILKNTDASFSKWAINELVNWKRKNTNNAIVRIHGDKDRVLPITSFQPHYKIKNAGHFAVVTHADEISSILLHEIKSIC